MFFGVIKNQDGHLGLLLADTFSTEQPQNGIWTKPDRKREIWLANTVSTSSLKHIGISLNLIGSKNSTLSTMLVYFGPIGKLRLSPCPLIGWDSFDLCSTTVEQNSVKLYSKQDHYILFQVCVFRTDWKTKMIDMASDWLRHFSTSPLQPQNGISMKLERKQELNVLYKACIFRSETQMAAPRHFQLLLCNR